MNGFFALSDYIEAAMSVAAYDKLENGTFAGRIPACKGLFAFGATLRACEQELRSVLEDWILVGFKLGHPLPVIAGRNVVERIIGLILETEEQAALGRLPT